MKREGVGKNKMSGSSLPSFLPGSLVWWSERLLKLSQEDGGFLNSPGGNNQVKMSLEFTPESDCPNLRPEKLLFQDLAPLPSRRQMSHHL
jgi:hypothetical protein